MIDRPLAISLYQPPDAARSAPLRHEISASELIDSLAAEHIEVGAKSAAPAWSPFVYSGARKLAAECVRACALVYDLDSDGVHGAAIEALEAQIVARGWRYALHETHTAGRYRLTLPLASDCAPRDYSPAWWTIARELDLTSLDLDEDTSDLSRVYYSPSCPPGEAGERYASSGGLHLLTLEDYYKPSNLDRLAKPSRTGQSPDSAHLAKPSRTRHTPNPSAPVEGNEGGNSEAPKIFDLGALREYLRGSRNANARELLNAIDGKSAPAEGGRDNTFTSWTSILAHAPERMGVTWEVALSLLTPAIQTAGAKEGWDHWEPRVRRMFDTAHRKAQNHRAQAKAAGDFLLGKISGEQPGETPNWRDALDWRKDKNGNPTELKASEANVLEVLRHDDAFRGLLRFNVLRKRIEVTGGPLTKAPPESLDVALAVWFQQSLYRASVDRTKAAAVLLHAALENPYDPVQEYFARLPKWDGVRRLDTVLTRLAGAQGNHTFVHSITRKFFLAAVARAMNPGCQVDTVLVLQGAQGGGKTSFVRVMGAGFHVETKLDLHNKDAVMVATSNWLVELSELASLKRGDVESIRAFVSNKEDQIRLPYGRSVESFPRRCVFIGTTNSLQPLSDQEGNRRFWVVSVGTVQTEQLAAERDQLWAEALAAYSEGERWWLERDEQLLADEEASVYTVEDSVESAILSWLAEAKTIPETMTPTQICTKVLMKPIGTLTSQDLQAASRAAGRMGWLRTRRRVGGTPVWTWVLPKRKEEASE